MTSLNTQLWELITTHKMPDDASGLSFANQLICKHGISRETADVAVAEYHKFIYLCMTRRERNVPSQAVDLVWHLHLEHTRDYWDVFCKKLGKPIHHNPGGSGSENLGDYDATVKAYENLFGTPPKGIWRQSNKAESVSLLGILLVIAAFLSISGFQEGFQLNDFLGLAFVSYFIWHSAVGSTVSGRHELVFNNKDPFSDDHRGSCGSCGDGGGCGD